VVTVVTFFKKLKGVMMSEAASQGNNLSLQKASEALIEDFKKELEALRTEQTALQQAKADIAYIRESKTELEELKQFYNTTRGSLEADVTALNGDKSRLAALKKQLEDEVVKANAELTALKSEVEDLKIKKTALETTIAQIDEMKSSAQITKDSVVESVKEIENTKASFDTLKNSTQNQSAEISNQQIEINLKLEEANKLLDAITKLHNAALVDELDEGGNKRATSIDSKLKSLQQQLKAGVEEIKQLKPTLAEEIRSLLPKAGAAGLSSAYFEAKSKYAYVPYKGNLNEKFYWLKNCLHWVGSYLAPLANYTMFIAPLIAILVLFYDAFNKMSGNDASFLVDGFFEPLDAEVSISNGNNGAHLNPEIWLFRILFCTPLAIISWFGWNSIRMNRRLFEEYNHKQRVMQLYHSFKKEVDGEGTPEQKQALLTIMLKTVSDKPTIAMQKYDKDMSEILPLNLANLLPSVFRRGTPEA